VRFSGEAGFLAFASLAVILLFVFFLSVPLFGDTLGYGYSTVRWMRDNGYTPFAAGDGKGEQAMGHPTLFFWLWALISALLGETLATARLMPAVATFLSLWGMYRLGRRLASPMAGWLAALTLLASPLFLIQCMRPMPDSAVVAAVVWSLYFYVKDRYFPAALLCALGVAFREQAIFLAAAFFLAELTETGVRRPGRLLLLSSPLLVIAFTGLVNLAVNGYFFFPTYTGEGSSLPQGWFLQRIRLFGTHLLAEDHRWILVTAAVAGILRDRGRDRHSLPFILALLFPALLPPPERLLFIAFAGLGVLVYMVRERLYTTKLSWVFILVPFFMVMFHVLIVMQSPDPVLDLFRYVLPAYPFILLGGVIMLFRYYSKKTAAVLGLVFLAGTAYSNRTIRRAAQPDTSLACAGILMDYGEAVLYAASLGDTVLVSDIDSSYFTSPECGTVGAPVPVRNILQGGELSDGVEYTLLVATFMAAQGNLEIAEAMVPSGSRIVMLDEPIWNDGTNRVSVYRVIPR